MYSRDWLATICQVTRNNHSSGQCPHISEHLWPGTKGPLPFHCLSHEISSTTPIFQMSKLRQRNAPKVTHTVKQWNWNPNPSPNSVP